MLGVKDKGILLQIIKRCNRVIEKVSNISETFCSVKLKYEAFCNKDTFFKICRSSEKRIYFLFL